MTFSTSTNDSRADDPRRVPGWLLLCVWVMILAICLLQISLAERSGEWRIVALDWGPWLLLAPLIIWLSARWPIEQKTWRWTVPVHIALSLLVTASLATLAWQSVMMRFTGNPRFREFIIQQPASRSAPPPNPVPGEPGDVPPPHEMELPPPPNGEFGVTTSRGPVGQGFGQRRLFPPRRAPIVVMALTRGRGTIFFYWALLAMTHAVTYHRRSVLRERRALAAEARLAEARLTALQAQLQPHFLFNTLNTISALVYDKPAAADEMICSLSDLLRRVLAASNRREVPLAEEISMARSYAAIQRVRFSEILEVRWEIPDDLGRAAVPTLLLQPLVENAVVHAVELGNRPCAITIRASRAGARLAIDVVNTGPGAAPSPEADKGLGIGLSNTQARLKELYGSDHVFNFALDPSGGAAVHIEVPYRIVARDHESSDRR